jgi:predicted P-loop ATPase
VRVGTIDLAALKRDRDLLWAEALYRFHNGEKWYLTEDEGKLAAAVQQDRVSEDIWQAKLQTEFEDKTEVAIAEAAVVVGLFAEKQNRAEQNRIVSILKTLGFHREGRFTSGKYRNAQRYARSLD